MSAFTFRKAVRDNVPLLIGFAGGTGSGKTFSALRLAKGLAGGKPFAVIDTEAGRAKHYAEAFTFDHGDLRPPFRPDAYIEAIEAADKANYPVVVVDSMSHIWSGDGGVLDWQEDELNRMAGDNYQKREAVKMAAWIKPKMSHKQMVARLLQVRAHVILCFRAEEKIEMVKEEGKTVIRPSQRRTGLDGWVPICEKNLPYELTLSFLLTADAPGVPKPIKLEEQHRAFFPAGRPVTEEAGEKLAQWAHGGAQGTPDAEPKPLAQSQSAAKAKPKETPFGSEDWNDAPQPASSGLLGKFFERAEALGYSEAQVLSFAQVDNLEVASRDDLQGILDGLKEATAQNGALVTAP